MSPAAPTPRPSPKKLSDAKLLKQLSVSLLCAAEMLDPTYADYREDSVDSYREIYNERAMEIAKVIVRIQKRRFAAIRRMIMREDAR